MGNPRCITFKEAGDADTWEKINAITGAGVPTHEDAAIGITDLSKDQITQIDALLEKNKKSIKEGK
jgi:hypothetical protein